MKKKHPTKKHTTKKHLTKSRVKANIIAISATGILVGVTAITLGVYFGVTSCKSNPTPTPPGPGPIPPDSKIITENIDGKYIVQSDENIWTSTTTQSNSHNKLLDLALYSSDKQINTSDFVIEGEIDFGILIDFNENVNLFGYSQSLIKLGTEANPLIVDTCYGIVVGNTSSPTTGEDVYCGGMDIDSSVNILIYSNGSFGAGVELKNASNASINIDGMFTINANSNVTGVEFFGNVSNNVNIDIDGMFTINSSDAACGVNFNHVTGSDFINIGGEFAINSFDCNSNVYGVYFYELDETSDGSRSINIDGAFTIITNAPTHTADEICGVEFGHLSWNYQDSRIFDIEGTFMITALGDIGSVYGIKFENLSDAYDIDINGTFTINSNNGACYGVNFDDVNGSYNINIDGVFIINNSGGRSAGVNFNVIYVVFSMDRSYITIDGVFMINTYGSGFSLGVKFSNFFCDASPYYQLIDIDGVFTISNVSGTSSDNCGVLLDDVSNANINIDGVFTVNFLGSTGSTYGVYATTTVNSCIDVNGVFMMKTGGSCYGINIGNSCNTNFDINGTFVLDNTSGTKGINFDYSYSDSYDTYSNPQFFAKKTDSGNLFSMFPNAQYEWNGRPITPVSSTTEDYSLENKPVIAHDNPNFWINVIETTLKASDGVTYNQNVFNQAYKDELNNYIINHPACPADVAGWLTDIINQIPFKT